MSTITQISGFDPEGPFAGLLLPHRFRKRQKETRFKQEWKLTKAQYLAMMREFKGPAKQRGIICATAIYGGVTGEVLLDTAWTLTNHNAGGISTCGITFNSDGSMSAAQNGGGDTLPAADNWWTENPATAVGDDYEVAFTAWDGGSEWNLGAAINVWTRIDSNVTWNCRVIAKGSPDVMAANGVTFEIRPFGGGSTIDSIANCNHSATN